MGIIAWIIFGLIAGIIAKLIMPGRDGGGFFLTCILGIVGAVVGGWLATMFGIGGSISGFNLHSFLVAVRYRCRYPLSHQNVYSTPALRVKKINIALRYPIKSVPGNNNRILF